MRPCHLTVIIDRRFSGFGEEANKGVGLGGSAEDQRITGACHNRSYLHITPFSMPFKASSALERRSPDSTSYAAAISLNRSSASGLSGLRSGWYRLRW